MRAGTSVGVYHRAACRAKSKADLAAIMVQSKKTARTLDKPETPERSKFVIRNS